MSIEEEVIRDLLERVRILESRMSALEGRPVARLARPAIRPANTDPHVDEFLNHGLRVTESPTDRIAIGVLHDAYAAWMRENYPESIPAHIQPFAHLVHRHIRAALAAGPDFRVTVKSNGMSHLMYVKPSGD